MIEDNSPRLLAETLIEMGAMLSNYKSEVYSEKYFREDADEKLKKSQEELKRYKQRLSEVDTVFAEAILLLKSVSETYRGKHLPKIKEMLKKKISIFHER